MKRLWAQIVVVCWAAVLVWLVAFELFPSRGPVVRAVDPTATLAPVATTDTSEATATPRPSQTAEGTPRPCRNSFDPSCGQFRWDPSPANREMTISVQASTRSPKKGETVTVTVVAKDDTTVVEGYDGSWGDGSAPFGSHPACASASPGPARYGPWSPPDQEEDTFAFDVEHAYDRAGTYEFVVQVASGDGCTADNRYPNPYGEVGRAKLTVVVSG